ncbi:MAG TPA: hypothetical protein VM284_03690 [Candidatus Limnocylindria bacterium]|nr:hypothetical protein [Candidatus Limnocylindria bacterium]
MSDGWRFEYHASPGLPPLAWIARIANGVVSVDCGVSVRTETDGFFEGTWVGPPDLTSVAESTAPFGSGMVKRGPDLFGIPPGHTMALLFSFRRGRELYLANTLVGLLARAELELLKDTDYQGLFALTRHGLRSSPTDLPTSGGPAQYHLFENLRILPNGTIEKSPKRRERPFTSYADYVGRLDQALASSFANAPGYPPVIALSNGYDSTAVAVLAARHGLKRALTYREARPPAFTRDPSDSGERTAMLLGLDVEFFDRTEYMRSTTLPEAEFMATGYSGEEVPYVAFENELRHKTMLTGGLGGWAWLRAKEPFPGLERKDFSACSVTEFRLRADFIDLPIPMFGMTEAVSMSVISRSREMRPWSIGGYYDKPIARRIIEEAGIARGTFATAKRAATALIHIEGAALMAPASVESVRVFAAREGRVIDLSPRRRPTRLDRGLTKLARLLRVERVAAPLAARQRDIVHHRPQTGSILFRWGVANIRSRYASMEPARTRRV